MFAAVTHTHTRTHTHTHTHTHICTHTHTHTLTHTHTHNHTHPHTHTHHAVRHISAAGPHDEEVMCGSAQPDSGPIRGGGWRETKTGTESERERE